MLALGLALVWLIVDPRTPDLAAQLYRVGLYEHNGFAVFDEHWYAGHSLPGYGLLFAPLASVLGMRVVGALSVIGSALLFERLVLGAYGRELHVRLGACLFALLAVGDIWSGRLTFALGVTFALACALALSRSRAAVAAILAGVCAAASPVAGLLLALAGVTYALHLRSVRVLCTVILPVGLVLGALQLLFGEGGFEPFPSTSFLATALVTVAFLYAVPRRERLLRLGAILYLLACALALAIHTPLGSNIERYAVLLAGPLLLCSPAPLGGREHAVGAGALARSGQPRGAGAIAALCVIVAWSVWGPVRETAAVAGSSATSAAYYAPVERYLLAHGASLERTEVPLTRSHWEAAFLAPGLSLARGWEKQLDERYDRVLLDGQLTAGSYYQWLRSRAVSYVALPDVPLDPSSAQEGALIRGGLPYLRPVFSDHHWRIYAVRGAEPMLEGPGRLTALGHDSFALDARAAGSFLVRVHYSRYLSLSSGEGCVQSAPGGWTRVRARGAGAVVVAAGFTVQRALDGGRSCRRS